MVIVRTTLATLVLVAIASLAYGGDQNGPGQHGCDKGCGKEPCPKGCGTMNCCGEQACCTTKCGSTEIEGNCYKCVCTPVCLPTRPCCPFRDPACGCDKGKGTCDPKGGCGHGCNRGCGECGKGKESHEGKTTCSTKDGLLCHLGKGCGSCGKGDEKGCGKDPCDPKDGKAGGCDSCGKGGLLGNLLGECCSCKSRVKKHLYVKSVVVCELPKLECVNAKGCGGGDKVDGKTDKVDGGADEPEAAPDVPEPPPVKVGALRVPVVSPVSYTSTGSLGSMFK
jgi:hypothetical protein